MFATQDGKFFPAALALSGQCHHLKNASDVVFVGLNHTINLQIEVFILYVILDLSLIPILYLQWPGYEGWGAQVGIMSPG